MNHEGTKARGLLLDPVPERVNDLATAVVDSTFRIHAALGPGLLESVYETCLAHELSKRGLRVERQVGLPVLYDGIRLNLGFRLDLWVEREVIVEVKAVEALSQLHKAQVLTYLKLTHRRLGLLINFNTEVIREGIRRVIR